MCFYKSIYFDTCNGEYSGDHLSDLNWDLFFIQHLLDEQIPVYEIKSFLQIDERYVCAVAVLDFSFVRSISFFLENRFFHQVHHLSDLSSS